MSAESDVTSSQEDIHQEDMPIIHSHLKYDTDYSIIFAQLELSKRGFYEFVLNRQFHKLSQGLDGSKCICWNKIQLQFTKFKHNRRPFKDECTAFIHFLHHKRGLSPPQADAQPSVAGIKKRAERAARQLRQQQATIDANIWKQPIEQSDNSLRVESYNMTQTIEQNNESINQTDSPLDDGRVRKKARFLTDQDQPILSINQSDSNDPLAIQNQSDAIRFP